MENIFDDVSYMLAEILRGITASGSGSVNDLLGNEKLTRQEVSEILFRNDCDSDSKIRRFAEGVVCGAVGLSSLSAKEKYALADRCFCALDWIGSFRTSNLPLSLPADFSREELLVWLLTSLWDHRRELWVKTTAASIEDGFHYGESYLFES